MINFSENIESLEEIIIAYLLKVDDDSKITDESGVEVDRVKLIGVMKPDFFTVQFYNDIFKHVRDFYYEYNKIPNLDELKKLFELKNDTFDTEKIESIKQVRVSTYSNDFIYKYIKAFLMVRVLNSQINKVAIKLKTEKPDPDNINSVVDYVRTELSEKIDVEITNSGNGLDIYNIDDHIQKNKQTKSTGVEYLDIVLGGGYEPKTLLVFQGRAKIGKSMFMSNLATRAALLGNNVGIYTVELGADKYIKRVGSNLFNVPAMEYNKIKTKESAENSIIAKSIKMFREQHPNAGDIDIAESPTGSATVLDIENYYIKWERKHGKKLDVIFVDYLNLLKADSSLTGNMYLSIKRICEDLRKIAQRNKWCIVSATQIKTSQFASDDLGLDSTAESSGLIATVDTLFGLMGQPGSPYVKMKCIANRDGGYMNSYANFVKDMNFFRLLEDGEDYMNLGEEAILNAENYQKYREAPSKTYDEFQYRVMQNAEKQAPVEKYQVSCGNAYKIDINQPQPVVQAQAQPEIPQAPYEPMPMDETPIQDIVVVDHSERNVTVPADQVPVVPMNAPSGVIQYTTLYTEPQKVEEKQDVYIPKPVSAPTYNSVMAQAQPQVAQPVYQQQPVQQQFTQPVYQQPVAQQVQAQPQIQQPVQQPVYQQQPVQQPQYSSPEPNNQCGRCNDTSTLVVNNLDEAGKIAILNNNDGVQSIVAGL